MFKVFSFIQVHKTRILFVCVAIFVLTLVVFAVEEEQKIHVFPTKVESEGWMKEELSMEQTLGAFAVFDDFSRTNSSFVILTEEVVDEEQSATTNSQSTPSTSAPEDSDDTQEESDVVKEDVQGDSEGQEQERPVTDEHSSDTDIEHDVEEDVAPTEESLIEPMTDVSVFQYLRTIPVRVALTPAHAQDEPGEESGVIQEVPSETQDGEPKNNDSDAERTAVEENIDDESVSVVEDSELQFDTDDVAEGTSTEEELGEEYQASTTDEVNVASGTTQQEQEDASSVHNDENDYVDDVRVCEVLGTDCHTIQFSGFDIGSVLSEERVTSYTLKASLGARSYEEGFTNDKLLVRYFYRGSWHIAGEIVIDENVSNFNNGGHFTFPLPNLSGWDALHTLKVEFEFVRQSEVRTEVFLDSVWIETTFTPNDDSLPHFPNNVLNELAELEQSRRGDVLRTDDETVSMPFASEVGSDLVLRASVNTLESPGSGDVVFSVSNVGDVPKEFSLLFHMPDRQSEPQVVRQWMSNIPEEREVVELGSLAQYCEEGWVVTGSEGSGEYECITTKEILTCDELNDSSTNCIRHNAEVGRHSEVAYKEGWHEKQVREANMELEKKSFFQRLRKWFRLGEQPAPESAIVYEGGDAYTIGPNQTLYYSVRMRYPELSQGGFTVEAHMEEISPRLDIAWVSDYRYRIPVEFESEADEGYRTILLTTNDVPHLFAHIEDWSDLFIREFESHRAKGIPYTHTVMSEGEVELRIDTSNLKPGFDGIYIYYGESKNKQKEPLGNTLYEMSQGTSGNFETGTSSGERIRMSAKGYTFGEVEEVVIEEEPYHRVLSGIDSDGGIADDGTVVFAYRTHRTELIDGSFAKIPTTDTFTIRNVSLTHNSEGDVPNVTVRQTIGNEWLLDMGARKNMFKPGKYVLTVEVVEGGKTYFETQDFYWGVLTFNTTKSLYARGETARMEMAVLSDNGNTICDAQLTLVLRSPSGVESFLPVQKSGVCDGNTVVSEPDYTAQYTLEEVGTYEILLQHVDELGTILHEITDRVEVEETTPFIIEREGPTRIYPVADYSMTLWVSSTEGFTGTVREVMPEYFAPYGYGDADEFLEGDTRVLEWNVSLAPGEVIGLTYTFDAPDISPYVYRLGPASLSSEFVEYREWQIASDAVGNMLLLWAGNTVPAGWTCVSCTAGDPFYQRFIIGSSTYNTTGGATTHTHSATGTVYAIGTGSTEAQGSGVIEVAGHTHTYTPTISSSSNLPQYRTLRVIRYNSAGEPASLPTGAIAFFDASVPTGWTRYSAQDGYFIYGENTPGTTGGTSTHNHTISGSTGASVGGSVGSRGGGTQATGATDAHTHTVSGSSLFGSNEPPYVGVILGQLDATTTPPNGMISMWTEEVPTGWATLSSSSEPFENKFIKPSASYGGSGGTVQHTHLDVTGLTSSTVAGASSRVGSAGAGSHSHTVDVTSFSTIAHLPPYTTAVFGKRYSNEPIYTQNNFRIYANENAEPPTDPWPSGATDLLENERITVNEYTSQGDVVRFRISVQVTNATSSVDTDAFKLQYAEGSSCGDGSLVWEDVAPISSSTAPWRGHNNSGLTDGISVSSTTLSTSGVFGSYEEENPSASTTNEIAPGEEAEWDWVVEHNEASAGTDYCFRMVESDDTVFSGYNNYPQLITDEAPGAPTLVTLFDNQKVASTTPTFTFYATDPEGSSIEYQIQIDDDNQFGSPVIDTDSITSPNSFRNTDTPADKSPFNSGDVMSYTSATTLTNNTTYWWRVRGQDPDGSGQWGDWSSSRSFTIDTSVIISTWYQTTDEQFETDTLTGTVVSGGSDQVVLITGSTTGSVISSTIDFDWGTDGNAWGYLYFTDTETTSDLKYQVEFYDADDLQWELIPDVDLAGNSTGFDTSGVSLLALDTTTYNQIRLRATFTYTSASPILHDWTVEWGTRVQQPTLVKLFDNEKVGTTTPVFEFYTTDPQEDGLTYEINWSTDYTFGAGVTSRVSDTDAGFQNIASSTNTDPFVSGDTIRFTVQGVDALSNNSTYWWRVRAKDPAGGDTWSDWSERWSFTVDTTVVASTWFQTTDEQFDTGGLFGITTLADSSQVATSVNDVLIAYGQGTSETPKYRLWNGTAWSNEYSALNVGAAQYWIVTRAHPSAEMYALATLGSDADVNVQLYEDGVWGNLQEMTTTISNTNARGVDMAFETLSGDLVVVYCDGDADPSYRTYNESTGWSSAGAINLSSTNNCEWIRVAPDPTSDEILMVSLDAGGTQYEAQVWNGSTWDITTSMVMGSIQTSGNEGMAVLYEESGNQGIVITSGGNPGRFYYNTWNGTAWSGASTQTIGNDFEWGNLVRDKGTDAMAVCYIDEDNDIGVVHWTGSAWTSQAEIETVGNADTDRPVDCEYETSSTRDGYLMVAYSDETNGRYQSWNGTAWSAEGSVSTITDSATVQTARADDGLLLSVFFDDVNGRYDFSYWNGSSWSSSLTLEDSPSVTGSPFKEPFMMAPRNSAVEGTLYSPSIDYDDGTGPLWDMVSWNDATPGASTLLYQIEYYNNTTSQWELVPDGVLSGNSSGTSTSPLDIGGLDTSTYNQIRIKATFTCDSGNCPTVYDWTVTWSEGFTVSGIAKQFDQVSDVSSGVVAIAVNGNLQIGKTGTISGGVWTINNVTAFPDDILTVWIDGANEAQEAVAVTQYDGDASITGITLYERHLSIGSDDNPTISNADLSLFDNSVSGDEDIFIDVDSSGNLYVCEVGQATCGSERLFVRTGSEFEPSTSTPITVHTHDIDIEGTINASGNTFEVSGSWENAGIFTSGTSLVIFDATSSSESIDSTSATTSSFADVTFGQGSSNATWSLSSPFDVNGNLTIAYGTLAPGSGYEIYIAEDLTIGVSGAFTKSTGTTTFDGTVTGSWTDLSTTPQDMGLVVVDGTGKTVSLLSDVTATDLVIGTNDILALGGNTLEITGSFNNTGSLVPQLGEVLFTATVVGNTIRGGASSFYDITFDGTGGNWSFPSGSVSATNDFSIIDGIVTMPNGTTTIGGSLIVSGGQMVHNNGLVYFISNTSETITVQGSSFYDIRFNGNGDWTITDATATSSNNVTISNGELILPTDTFAIGGSLTVTNGTFAHSSGTVRFYSVGAETISTHTSDFYNVLFDGVGSTVVFTENSVSILNDLLLQAGSITLPSGVCTIGGSFENTGGSFVHNSGEVSFTADSIGQTVRTSGSNFYDVTFDNVLGGWTLVDGATSEGDWSITSATEFVAPNAQTIEVRGIFTNSVGGTETTWTNATLYINNGTSSSINLKSDTGDTYTVLQTGVNTEVKMWNSSASTYTIDDSGYLYSQDHAGSDGDLYIWGGYTRDAGTEYWSYDTDFDGEVLSGGGERQVSVRFADGAFATVTDATLIIGGNSLATTSIDVQSSGGYGVVVENGTVSAEFYSFVGLNESGFSITGSSTVTELGNSEYVLAVDGGTLLKVSSTTLDANPAKQFSNLDFSTTTSITGYNVGVLGVPSSYWTFRDHTGGLSGEMYDDDPGGNPGNLRWDDSAFVIDISGTVYSNEGSGIPAFCDNVTPVVFLKVDGLGNYATFCNSGTGAYTISGVTFSGDVVLTAYLKVAGTSGAVVTKTPNGSVTDFDIYEHRVIVRHEDVSPLSISDMSVYDNDDDADLGFTAEVGSPHTLTLEPDTGLQVWRSKQFAPGGDINLVSGGSGASYDGTMRLSENATLRASGAEEYFIGGSWIADASSVFVMGSSKITFTATTTGKTIAPASNFYSVEFNGTGGVWNIASSTTVRRELLLSAGTVTGTGDITVYDGPITGDGIFSMTGGTVTVLSGGSFGGDSDWTFDDLIFSTSTATTTSKIGLGDVTVLGTCTIGVNHTLLGGSTRWIFSGSGEVFVPDGLFTPQTSTVEYVGVNDATIASTDYYALSCIPIAGDPTYTIDSGNFEVGDTFTVGNGAQVTVDADTNDPLLSVTGNMVIATNATYESASSNDLLLSGSYENNGTFVSNSGGVVFNSSDTGETISSGGSSFHHVYFANDAGGWTILDDTTATGNFLLSSSSAWALASGQTLEVQGYFANHVGGANTTWTGATLLLNSGTAYSINTRTDTGDEYGTLTIGANTDVRMWYSTSSTYSVSASGSLYSQDHASNDGDVYIFGEYVRSSGNDYWNYSTDFDGTALSGGSVRAVDVFIQNGSSVTLSGGGLQILGTTTATTTIQNQGSGQYGFSVTGGTLNADYYAFRDINVSGLAISGSPTVTSLSHGDFELAVTGGSLLTVSGSAITANPLRIMYGNRFATSSTAPTGTNVTATGVTGSSWRFTSHYGGFDGELYDSDPGGDPGYVIWDDSAAQITISGNVLGTDESSVSSVCDGSTPVVRFLINGSNARTASCNAGTGYYAFDNIVYNVGDVFTVYLDTNSGPKAVNVTVDPITNITDMHLYEDRVIVRHEGANPITIEDLDTYDADEDIDIPYQATLASPDTMVLDEGSKLIVWEGKTFEPNGNVTVPSQGSGTSYDGNLELKNSATFYAQGSENHEVGGSFLSGSGSLLVSGNSTFLFSATTTGKTIDTNTSSFANITFDGTGGEWTFVENNASTTGDFLLTSGSVILPSVSFGVGGSFVNNAMFTGSTTAMNFSATGSENITLSGYRIGNVVFSGTGAWDMTDTHATTTGSVHIISGTVTLPDASFAIRTDFDVQGGSFTQNNGSLVLYGSEASNIISFGSSSAGSILLTGSGSWVFEDSQATTTGSVILQNGGLTAPSESFAIGGSLVNDATFNANAGMLYFYATTTGHEVRVGGTVLGSVLFDGVGGGWTVTENATSTSSWILREGASFTMATGTTLEVGGIFGNYIGGSATDWTDATLFLNASGTTFSLNGKTDLGDEYAFLTVGENTHVSMWHSSGATTTVTDSGSLYSQDHDGNDGVLYIYGSYERTAGTEYWSYATDFDGVALGGSSRAVDVRIASSSIVAISGGGIQMLGVSGASTSVNVISSGAYTFSISGGTVNAEYYSIAGTDIDGLQLSGSPTITTLNCGAFELHTNGGVMLSVASSVINQNPSRTFTGNYFSTTTGVTSGYNVRLDGSTSNVWQFTGHGGNYDGEDYDDDGVDACGQIRWSNSACLEVSQTQYRFRNDNGGEGAPDSEWYDGDWGKRRPIKINNVGGSAIANHALRVEIPYDSDMQADFDDVRFTDSSGTTSLSYWFEDVVLSATATAWVKVPTVPADDVTRIYMYYGNALATSSENGANTFTFFDDFEDNNITEYSGSATDLSYFSTNASFNWEGSYGLSASGGNTDKQTSGGIYRTGTTFSQNSRIRFFQKVSAGTDDEPCTLFGVQGSGQNYAVCLDQYPSDRVVISEDVTSNSDDGTGTELSSRSVTWSTGWYEVLVDWLDDDSINVSVYDSTGTLFATTSATDASYTSGGMGFSFWYQSQGWDFYSVRPYVESEPSYNIGVEQEGNGATWSTLQNTPLSGQAPNENFRVRFTIENTGTQITNQTWRLQYAPKSSYGACEGVPSIEYNDVPIQSSCGVSPVCMTASAYITNQESSTEHLTTLLLGDFVNGHVVESPSNQTNSMTLEQNEYTEVEYSVEFTDFASDSNYCMRVTNGGTEVDTYLRVAEASVRFAPVISNWRLNGRSNIFLSEGETQTVYATGTISDLNGFSDLLYATTTIYRSGVGESCASDPNNCYRLTSLQCPFTNCDGNSCGVECSGELQYFAEPTDNGSLYDAEHWEAYLYVVDTTGNVATSVSEAVDVHTLWALSVEHAEIAYGTLGVGEDTGSVNATTTLQNTGNDNIDIEVAGTDMAGPGSAIPAGNQVYATTSFTYSSCTICSALSGASTPYEVDLAKPTSETTPVTDTLYWGVYVPLGTGGVSHYGQNTFYAIGD